MGVQSLHDNKILQDNALSQYLSWAGSSFPYNAGASDITISANTTWSDSIGFKKVKKLTINAGITLTINRFPFYIFADEINFGDTSSCIDASGPNAVASTTPFSTFNGAVGGVGYSSTSSYGIGGCGGGLLIILCNKITGANGVIKANGGNGIALGNGSTDAGVGGVGQSALSLYTGSPTVDYKYLIGVSSVSTISPQVGYINTVDNILANSTLGINRGIGGGGAFTGQNAVLPLIKPTILDLLFLAEQKCLGGGGGTGNRPNNSGACAGSGGGGGAVIVFTHAPTATPTLQANAGTGTANGCAGVTYLLQI